MGHVLLKSIGLNAKYYQTVSCTYYMFHIHTDTDNVKIFPSMEFHMVITIFCVCYLPRHWWCWFYTSLNRTNAHCVDKFLQEGTSVYFQKFLSHKSVVFLTRQLRILFLQAVFSCKSGNIYGRFIGQSVYLIWTRFICLMYSHNFWSAWICVIFVCLFIFHGTIITEA